MRYKMYYVASFGCFSPCMKKKAEGDFNRIYLWKCRYNEYGTCTSSEFISGPYYTYDQIEQKNFIPGEFNAREEVRLHFRLKDRKW